MADVEMAHSVGTEGGREEEGKQEKVTKRSVSEGEGRGRMRLPLVPSVGRPANYEQGCKKLPGLESLEWILRDRICFLELYSVKNRRLILILNVQSVC